MTGGESSATCFLCGQPAKTDFLTISRAACGPCHARTRLVDGGASLPQILRTSSRPHPLEGNGLNAVLNPVEIDGHRGWASFYGGSFQVRFQGREQGTVAWDLIGMHNVLNALAALAAARHAGVPVKTGCAALAEFRNVKRRLEMLGTLRGISVYDDFAHHPTAIQVTLEALRARVGAQRIFAVLEARSNTMRMGVHRAQLAPALAGADQVLLFQPAEFKWDINIVTTALNGRGRVFRSVDEIVTVLAAELKPGDQVLIMSNGGFDGIHAKLLARLAA